MLRSKKRRTKNYDKNGNPKFNTNNCTVNEKHYVMRNNYIDSLKTVETNSKKCKNYKTNVLTRIPLKGYRKQLLVCNNNCKYPKNPTNTVYKDNYAKTFGGAIELDISNCCYNNKIKRIQNNNGKINYKYNYSSQQYLNRRCRTYEQQSFNFAQNTPIKGSKNSEFPTYCENNGVNNCKSVYKKNNPKFSTEGGVSGGSRINRLKYQTVVKSQQIVSVENPEYENKIIDTFNENYDLLVGKNQTSLTTTLYGFNPEYGKMIPETFKNYQIISLFLIKVTSPPSDTIMFYIEFSDELKYILTYNERLTLQYIISNEKYKINIPFFNYNKKVKYDGVEYNYSFTKNDLNYSLIEKLIDNGNIVGTNIRFQIKYKLENKTTIKVPVYKNVNNIENIKIIENYPYEITAAYTNNDGLDSTDNAFQVYGYNKKYINNPDLMGNLTPQYFLNKEISCVNLIRYYSTSVTYYGFEFQLTDYVFENLFDLKELETVKFIISFKDMKVTIPYSDRHSMDNYKLLFYYDNSNEKYNIIGEIIKGYFNDSQIIGQTFKLNITYETNKVISNAKMFNNRVNGEYPVSLYKNTFPQYKSNLNGLIKCNTHTCNGIRQNCFVPPKK